VLFEEADELGAGIRPVGIGIGPVRDTTGPANLIAAVNVQNQALHPTPLHCVTGYPCFYPAGYAFDLVVPLINIHQAEFWQPNGHHWLGWAWVTGAWTVTALGWGLATLLVVGYSGLARQQ
jgi:hypothetical protein